MAASAKNDNAPLGSFAKVAATGSTRDVRKENVPIPVIKKMVEQCEETSVGKSRKDYTTVQRLSNTRDRSRDSRSEEQEPQDSMLTEASLVDAVKALNVQGPMPSLVVNGSGTSDVSPRAESVEVFSEDAFQRTDSGSELGTKPPSLDGKSITSGTTFALDEKESLAVCK